MKTSLLSVGIDIGTTTTQVVFSRLTLANSAPAFSAPKVEIVRKETLYRGRVRWTPLLAENRLDGGALRRLVAEEFRLGGFTREDVDTGAAIVTGEAARKENARAVLEMAGALAGDFVVAAAGPDMEGVIAGKGSGAAGLSRREGNVVANLDIGGGTTNIAVFASGEAVATGCYDIGGRLVRFGRNGRVEHVSPAAALVAESVGVGLRAGGAAGAGELRAVAAAMNRLLEQALGLAPRTALLERLETPGSSRLSPPARLDAIAFSGGVADCVYDAGRDDFAYGDIGVMLGKAVAAGRLPAAGRLLTPGETIRATVIGAGSCAVTVSGSTIGFAEGVLPGKGLCAVTLRPEAEEALYRGDGEALRDRLLRTESGGGTVLWLRGRHNPGYGELKAAARAIAEAFDRARPGGGALFVAVEKDVGKALALCLERVLNGRRPVVCVDGLTLADGDYLDLGNPVMGGVAVPAVIRTLVFG